MRADLHSCGEALCSEVGLVEKVEVLEAYLQLPGVGLSNEEHQERQLELVASEFPWLANLIRRLERR